MDIFKLIWAVVIWVVRLCLVVSIIFLAAVFLYALTQAEYLISLICIAAGGILIWGARNFLVIKKTSGNVRKR